MGIEGARQQTDVTERSRDITPTGKVIVDIFARRIADELRQTGQKLLPDEETINLAETTKQTLYPLSHLKSDTDFRDQVLLGRSFTREEQVQRKSLFGRTKEVRQKVTAPLDSEAKTERFMDSLPQVDQTKEERDAFVGFVDRILNQFQYRNEILFESTGELTLHGSDAVFEAIMNYIGEGVDVLGKEYTVAISHIANSLEAYSQSIKNLKSGEISLEQAYVIEEAKVAMRLVLTNHIANPKEPIDRIVQKAINQRELTSEVSLPDLLQLEEVAENFAELQTKVYLPTENAGNTLISDEELAVGMTVNTAYRFANLGFDTDAKKWAGEAVRQINQDKNTNYTIYDLQRVAQDLLDERYAEEQKLIESGQLSRDEASLLLAPNIVADEIVEGFLANKALDTDMLTAEQRKALQILFNTGRLGVVLASAFMPAAGVISILSEYSENDNNLGHAGPDLHDSWMQYSTVVNDHHQQDLSHIDQNTEVPPEHTSAQSALANLAQDTVEAKEPIEDSVAHACFLAGTIVYTLEGDLSIEKLKKGDKVFSWNVESEELISNTIVKSLVREEEGYFEVKISDVTLKVTEEHPIYVVGKDFVKVKDLEINDEVVVITEKDASFEKVSEISKVDEKVTVYNIEVEKPNNYFANGVLVHNKLTGNVGDFKLPISDAIQKELGLNQDTQQNIEDAEPGVNQSTPVSQNQDEITTQVEQASPVITGDSDQTQTQQDVNEPMVQDQQQSIDTNDQLPDEVDIHKINEDESPSHGLVGVGLDNTDIFGEGRVWEQMSAQHGVVNHEGNIFFMVTENPETGQFEIIDPASQATHAGTQTVRIPSHSFSGQIDQNFVERLEADLNNVGGDDIALRLETLEQNFETGAYNSLEAQIDVQTQVIKYGETPEQALRNLGLSGTDIYGSGAEGDETGVWDDLTDGDSTAIVTDGEGKRFALLMVYNDPNTTENTFRVINPDPNVDGTPANSVLVKIPLADNVTITEPGSQVLTHLYDALGANPQIDSIESLEEVIQNSALQINASLQDLEPENAQEETETPTTETPVVEEVMTLEENPVTTFVADATTMSPEELDEVDEQVNQSLIDKGFALRTSVYQESPGWNISKYTVEVNLDEDSGEIITGRLNGAPQFFEIEKDEIPTTSDEMMSLIQSRIDDGTLVTDVQPNAEGVLPTVAGDPVVETESSPDTTVELDQVITFTLEEEKQITESRGEIIYRGQQFVLTEQGTIYANVDGSAEPDVMLALIKAADGTFMEQVQLFELNNDLSQGAILGYDSPQNLDIPEDLQDFVSQQIVGQTELPKNLDEALSEEVQQQEQTQTDQPKEGAEVEATPETTIEPDIQDEFTDTATPTPEGVQVEVPVTYTELDPLAQTLNLRIEGDDPSSNNNSIPLTIKVNGQDVNITVTAQQFWELADLMGQDYDFDSEVKHQLYLPYETHFSIGVYYESIINERDSVATTPPRMLYEHGNIFDVIAFLPEFTEDVEGDEDLATEVENILKEEISQTIVNNFLISPLNPNSYSHQFGNIITALNDIGIEDLADEGIPTSFRTGQLSGFSELYQHALLRVSEPDWDGLEDSGYVLRVLDSEGKLTETQDPEIAMQNLHSVILSILGETSNEIWINESGESLSDESLTYTEIFTAYTKPAVLDKVIGALAEKGINYFELVGIRETVENPKLNLPIRQDVLRAVSDAIFVANQDDQVPVPQSTSVPIETIDPTTTPTVEPTQTSAATATPTQEVTSTPTSSETGFADWANQNLETFGEEMELGNEGMYEWVHYQTSGPEYDYVFVNEADNDDSFPEYQIVLPKNEDGGYFGTASVLMHSTEGDIWVPMATLDVQNPETITQLNWAPPELQQLVTNLLGFEQDEQAGSTPTATVTPNSSAEQGVSFWDIMTRDAEYVQSNWSLVNSATETDGTEWALVARHTDEGDVFTNVWINSDNNPEPDYYIGISGRDGENERWEFFVQESNQNDKRGDYIVTGTIADGKITGTNDDGEELVFELPETLVPILNSMGADALVERLETPIPGTQTPTPTTTITPEPTNTPTVTSTPTATSTSKTTATATNTSVPTAIESATNTPEPTATLESTQTVVATETSTAQTIAGVVQEATAEVEPTTVADATATQIPVAPLDAESAEALIDIQQAESFTEEYGGSLLAGAAAVFTLTTLGGLMAIRKKDGKDALPSIEEIKNYLGKFRDSLPDLSTEDLDDRFEEEEQVAQDDALSTPENKLALIITHSRGRAEDDKLVEETRESIEKTGLDVDGLDEQTLRKLILRGYIYAVNNKAYYALKSEKEILEQRIAGDLSKTDVEHLFLLGLIREIPEEVINKTSLDERDSSRVIIGKLARTLWDKLLNGELSLEVQPVAGVDGKFNLSEVVIVRKEGEDELVITTDEELEAAADELVFQNKVEGEVPVEETHYDEVEQPGQRGEGADEVDNEEQVSGSQPLDLRDEDAFA